MEATRNKNIFPNCMRKINENNQFSNLFLNFWFFNCTSQFNREFCQLHEFQLIYTKSSKIEVQFWGLCLKLLNIFENYEKILENNYELFWKRIFNWIYHFIQPYPIFYYSFSVWWYFHFPSRLHCNVLLRWHTCYRNIALIKQPIFL